MSKTSQHRQNIIVVLGREWRNGGFDGEPAQCLEVLINDTLIISTPDASNLNDKQMLELMALTNPGPHLFLVRLEEGKQPDGVLKKWQKVFGEGISHNMIYIIDRNSDYSGLSVQYIRTCADIIKTCEQIIEDKHFTYSFREILNMRKQSEKQKAAKMETDQKSSLDSHSSVPDKWKKGQHLNKESGSRKREQIDTSEMEIDPHSPVPGGKQKSHKLNLVLLGESGSGKSASGNTILGNKAFKSKSSSIPVTTECKMETKFVCGTELRVIDTPDFFDEDLHEKSSDIQECIRLCKGGLCVYLLVIQIGRFTEGEREVLERLENVLDTRDKDRVRVKDKVRDRAIILFTHGDDLESDSESEIDEYVRDTNRHLKQLIEKCGKRYQVISNPTSHKRQAETQVKELMRKIVKLVEKTDGVNLPGI